MILYNCIYSRNCVWSQKASETDMSKSQWIMLVDQVLFYKKGVSKTEHPSPWVEQKNLKQFLLDPLMPLKKHQESLTKIAMNLKKTSIALTSWYRPMLEFFPLQRRKVPWSWRVNGMAEILMCKIMLRVSLLWSDDCCDELYSVPHDDLPQTQSTFSRHRLM